MGFQKEGSAGVILHLDSIRPAAGVPLIERRVEGGSLLICSGEQLRIQIILAADYGLGTESEDGSDRIKDLKVLEAIQSPRFHGKGLVRCVVTWRDGKFETTSINGVECVRPAPNTTVPKSILLKGTTNDRPRTDFHEQSKAAQVRRKHSLGGLHKNPKRAHGGKPLAFQHLKDEARQLADLLPMASAKEHHIIGLSSRLRTLLVGSRGSPFGLLQACAGYLDKPLTVYTSRDPGTGPPIAGGYYFAGGLSAKPQPYFENPIDLDVWLKLPQIRSSGEEYTALAVVDRIGSTTASHVDLDVHPLVADMRQTPGILRFNDVTRFIMMVGEAVLALALDLLRTYEAERQADPRDAAI